MRVAALLFLAATTMAACTTVLGDDFEIVTDTASTTTDSVTSSSVGGETSAGGSAGMSAGGNGTGGAGGEDCTNGVDDDADSRIDCEDDGCTAGYRCIPPVPTGWVGPIALSQVPHGMPKPTCPMAYSTEEYNGVEGVSAAPVTCNNCTCNSNNPTCTPSVVAHYGQSSCGGMFPLAGPNPVGGCQQQGALSGNISVRIGSPTASLNCMASGGGIASTPPPMWATASRACSYQGALGAGCMAGDVCAPITGGNDFGDNVCILKAGDEVCPAPFTQKFTYSDNESDVNDMRTCSQCGCMQQNATCSVNTQFFTSSNCSGSPTFTIANNNVCNNSNINGLYTKAIITGQPSGTCQVQQAQPQGSVTASGPFTTLCCLQ